MANTDKYAELLKYWERIVLLYSGELRCKTCPMVEKKRNKISSEDCEPVKLSELQEKLGYQFKNTQLLRTALTHASAIVKHESANEKEHRYYYEQLEFLGDRVLGLAISHMLYDMFPSEKEGDWAKRHSEAVREQTLAEISEAFNMGDYLFLSSGEQRSGGRKKKTILADVMEAVIAAIYLDSNYEAAQKFIETHWKDVLQRAPMPPEDPKTQLQEWLQAQGLPLPEYKLVSRSGPDHAPQFEVSIEVEGIKPITVTGTSKRRAEKKAAEMIIKEIEKDS